MLEVILLILKILGIILLSVLGLFLLIIILILFVPLRYRIIASKGTSNDDIYAKVNVSYLLHIFSVNAIYDKNFNIYAKVFGIPIYNKKKRDEKTSQADQIAKYNDVKEKVQEKAQEEAIDDLDEVSYEEVTYDIDWNVEEDGKEDLNDEIKEFTESMEESDENCEEDVAEEDIGFRKALRIVLDKLKAIASFMKLLLTKSEEAIDKLSNKITESINKYDSFSRFVNDYRNKRAFSLVLNQVKSVLRGVLPRKIKGRIHFGLEDPATTGQILMTLGLCAPFLPRRLEIVPDFENICIDGNIDIKGHITVIHIIIAACRLILNKDVRRMWRMYKAKKSA